MAHEKNKLDQKLSAGSAHLQKLTGWIKYHCLPRKTIIIVLSSMRSGSTLLKALLATAEDVSDIPETNYRSFSQKKYIFYDQVYNISPKKIIILKAPHWFENVKDRRVFPHFKNVKIIVLYRECAPVVKSLKKMLLETKTFVKSESELINYWCDTYENIHESIESVSNEVLFLRYEALAEHAKEETQKIFSFIGSKQKNGIDSYDPPTDYQWAWGSDDGGETIKSLKVQRPKSDSPELELNKLIGRHDRAKHIKSLYEKIQ